MSDEFPIHSDSRRRNPFLPASVPWAVVEGHERQAQENHYQSLERLAERGGLTVVELWAVCTDQSFPRTHADESTQVRALEWLSFQAPTLVEATAERDALREQLRWRDVREELPNFDDRYCFVEVISEPCRDEADADCRQLRNFDADRFGEQWTHWRYLVPGTVYPTPTGEQ